MKKRMAVGLLLAFAAASASETYGADGRSGGGRAVGRSGGPGPRHAAGTGGRSASGGHAVPRGYAGRGYRPPTGAQLRHPRAGTGTGGYYNRYGHHGHHPYYGHYPYYGYYPYPPYYAYPGYGLPGLGLGFYFSDGYAAPYYSAPYYYAGPPAASGGYYGGGYYGGGGYGAAPAPEPADAAVLLLEVVPDDASVWIDDEFRGLARDLARVALPPGRHRIEVVRPGFRTATEEVDLGPATATTLRLELERP
jgi:hypothetical protein